MLMITNVFCFMLYMAAKVFNLSIALKNKRYGVSVTLYCYAFHFDRKGQCMHNCYWWETVKQEAKSLFADEVAYSIIETFNSHT